MTLKSIKRNYIILMICSFLWSQQSEFIAHTIESSYRDKVVSTVSPLLGQRNFIVIVNVEFVNDNKLSSPQLGDNSSNSYTPIPGLPTVPSQYGSTSSRRKMGANDYSIKRITVNIELNAEIELSSVDQQLRSLVKKALPKLEECDDCINISSIPFLPSEKTSLEKQLDEMQEQLSILKSANELLENERRAANLKAEEKKYEEVQKKLADALQNEEKKYEEVQKKLAEFEEREIYRENLKREQDEILFKQSVENEKRHEENILKEKEQSDKKLEKMMNSKIRSDSLIISEAMDMYRSVMKQKGGADFDNEALLGMQIGNSGPGMLNAIIFLLLIVLVIILLFIALNKKNQPIYLKPKSKKKSDNDESVMNENLDSNTHTQPSLKQDDDSIRSEIKSLRQTAVSLTVGEKESASNLIKEWLDDNPNKGEASVE